MRKNHYDVVIIGGGASGLAAAIELGIEAPELSVAVLEKNDEPARKIRATGSGRCNITNTNAEGYDEILKFFGKIGLVTRAYDNGLVYPYSESAADVAELLISRAEELGAEIITGAEVTGIERDSDRSGSGAFSIAYSSGKGKSAEVVTAAKVILSSGGKAGPTYGTTGDGYKLARNFGHTIVTPVPVLTSIECGGWSEDKSLHSRGPNGIMLAGTRTRGVVKLFKFGNDKPAPGTLISSEAGEIQFTKYGLSGICVFNLTRHMRYDRSAGESLGNFEISADLYPDGDAEKFLKERRDNAFPGEKTGQVLRSLLKSNIASYVLGRADSIKLFKEPGEPEMADKLLAELSDSDIRAIACAVHHLTFKPERIRGWKEAQATSGGVALDEIDEATCESRLASGLYITGELADRDFPCGGYNLSNAWVTGLKAARAIACKPLS